MRRSWPAVVAVLVGTSLIALPASGDQVNKAPIARPDHLTATVDTPKIVLWGQLLSNDSPGRGERRQTVRVTGVADDPASPGSVFVTGGHAVFVPAAGFVGTARFSYTIRDNGGKTDTGTVRVTVNP